MTRFLKRFRRSEQGAAIIEMGIAAPFLVVLGLGTFELGNSYYHYHLISTGLHDAARYLARVDDFEASASIANAKQLALYGQFGSTVKRVSWWRAEDISVTPVTFANASGTYRGGDPIKVVRVSTNVTHPGLGFFSAIGIGQAFRINIFHEERHIGD